MRATVAYGFARHLHGFVVVRMARRSGQDRGRQHVRVVQIRLNERKVTDSEPRAHRRPWKIGWHSIANAYRNAKVRPLA